MNWLKGVIDEISDKFHIVLFIVGIGFVISAWLQAIPAGTDPNWLNHLSNIPNFLRLIIGAVFLGISFLSWVILQMSRSDGSWDSSKGTVAPLPNMSGLKLEKVVCDSFLKLSRTQKLIINEMFSQHSLEWSIDDAFKFFHEKHPTLIETGDELFFRVRDLQHKGLLGLKSIGANSSVMVWIPKVGTILDENDLIRSD